MPLRHFNDSKMVRNKIIAVVKFKYIRKQEKIAQVEKKERKKDFKPAPFSNIAFIEEIIARSGNAACCKEIIR